MLVLLVFSVNLHFGIIFSLQNKKINRLKSLKNFLFKPFSPETIRPKWLLKGKVPLYTGYFPVISP
jgi:hypothetical protein